MSAQPIPIGDLRKCSDNRIAVETAVSYLNLPAPVLIPRPNAVHITVTDVDDLGAWVYALGGEVHRGEHTDDAALWTLVTATPARADGSTVAVLVHVVVVDGEDVLTDVRSAVTA